MPEAAGALIAEQIHSSASTLTEFRQAVTATVVSVSISQVAIPGFSGPTLDPELDSGIAGGEEIDNETLSPISFLPYKHVLPHGRYFIGDDPLERNFIQKGAVLHEKVATKP